MRRNKEIADFLRGWSWGDVFRTWQNRLSELSVRVQPLFETIQVCDPANPRGREPALSWWPKDQIRELQKEVQRHLDCHPGTRGLVHRNELYIRKGELETVGYLWEQREDLEGIAAVLIAASVFSRSGSRREHYPRENWPPVYCVREVERWAYEAWNARAQYVGWHYSCTTVIPRESRDDEYKIDTLGGLIRYIAEEHAALLHRYRPVVIEYQSSRDPFIAKALSEEYEREAVRQREWEKEYQERHRKEAEELEQLKRNHPRWGEWNRIGKKELERLVWTKPTRDLAKEFGISDVAINKQCKKLGIKKPPVGFWNKVKAGKIPHPNGKPA